MTTLAQLPPSASSPEVVLNENFETVSGLAIYGKRQPASTGLTWGYYGGIFDGNVIANGTLTLSASATNYIVVARATGVISTSTATTNWTDGTNYCRIYKITTGASSVSAVEDHRVGPTYGLFR